MSRKFKPRNIPEKILPTVEIDNWSLLNLLFSELGQNDIQEIGCHFEGISEGRFTANVPEFLVLNVKDTLVALFLPKLAENEQGEKLWEGLGNHIFSNPEIVKVFFDCSAACDYLYHVHSISIVNAYDLKVADEYLMETGGFCLFSNENENKKTKKPKKETMTEFWEAYLPEQIPILEYVVFLKTTEPSKDQEFVDLEEYKYKGIALRAKYLLTLKAQMERAMMSPLQKLVDHPSSDVLNNEVRK